MFEKAKDKISALGIKLFAPRYVGALKAALDRKTDTDLKDYIAGLDVTDLVRHNLKGIRTIIDVTTIGDHDLPDYLSELDRDTRDNYLMKAKQYLEDGVFLPILSYLINSQAEFGIKNAKTPEEVWFGRATINGIALIRDEFERLLVLYEEEHPQVEIFNKHEII